MSLEKYKLSIREKYKLSIRDKTYLMRESLWSRRGLENLIAKIPENSIMIEIGSYSGESTEIFARSKKFKKIYCIDPWEKFYDEEDMTSFTNLLEAERKFNIVMEKYPILSKIKRKSSEASSLFEKGSVDFVYLDARHNYGGVLEDLNLFLPKIKEGGIIGGHDYYPNNVHDIEYAWKWEGVVRAVDEVFTKPDEVFEDTSWIKYLNKCERY
jgi:predicted O-methyltransferase YrrM